MSDSGKLNVAWLYDDSLDTNDGVTQYVKTLGGWLSDQGHHVTYLGGQSGLINWHGGKVYSLSKNLPVRWGGNRVSVPFWPRRRLINEVLTQNQFDVVHVTLPYSPLMSKQVIKKLPESTALVGTWHIYPANSLAIAGSKLLKLSYGRSLKRFDKFLSVSPPAANYARKVFGAESTLLPNAVVLPKTELQERAYPLIVFLGRLVERKGVEYLLRAFALLQHDTPDAKLVIAGRGPLEGKLRKIVNKLGISGAVKFLGFVEETDKYKLLGQADIACFPSLYGESFGIVLIEAMAAGSRVVIGGDNPGYRSVLAEKPELLVKPKNTAAFAARLRQYLDNQDLANNITKWQQQQLSRYDVETVGPELIKHYQQAIAKRRASRHN